MQHDRLGSLLILTEDSGRDGHETIVHVVKRMLKLIEPSLRTNRLGIEPRDDAAQRCVNGTRWKSVDPKFKADFTVVLRSIATKLGREDGFVFFHIDGDRTWKRRSSNENEGKFQKLVVEKIRALLRQKDPAARPETIEDKLGRLHLLMPFYSIESWLYQNTDVAIRVAREKYRSRDVETFERWKQDRTLLDDVEKPKEVVCLASFHNLTLAETGYPAQEVADAQRSYSTCIAALEKSEALRAFLRRTAAHEGA